MWDIGETHFSPAALIVLMQDLCDWGERRRFGKKHIRISKGTLKGLLPGLLKKSAHRFLREPHLKGLWQLAVHSTLQVSNPYLSPLCKQILCTLANMVVTPVNRMLSGNQAGVFGQGGNHKLEL